MSTFINPLRPDTVIRDIQTIYLDLKKILIFPYFPKIINL